MRVKAVNDEVLYPDEPIVVLDRVDIDTLKHAAALAVRRRSRLCAHRDVDDRVHEMLIVHPRGTYVRPHRHPGKTESFHVIEGTVDVVIFDDQGELATVMQMGDFASGRPFYYRMADPLYHTLLIRSDVLVFHETTSGPFNRADTVFAPWSPDDGDGAAARGFLEALEQRLRRRGAPPEGTGR